MNVSPRTEPAETRNLRRREGHFYVGMAIVAIVIAAAGFGPALFDTSSRRAPLTIAVGGHAIIFTAWILLFLAQTMLIPKGRIGLHRRLGYAGVFLAVLMVVSGYATSITMARRGFDLSGDLTGTPGDPLELLVFQTGDLLSFAVLVAGAVVFRRRSDVHKRLMLLATVGALMPAALAHLIGHFSFLRNVDAPIILIPLVALLFATAFHDRLSRGRIHPVSVWVAIMLFLWANLRAAIIGPSDAWHQFAAWLIS